MCYCLTPHPSASWSLPHSAQQRGKVQTIFKGVFWQGTWLFRRLNFAFEFFENGARARSSQRRICPTSCERDRCGYIMHRISIAIGGNVPYPSQNKILYVQLLIPILRMSRDNLPTSIKSSTLQHLSCTSTGSHFSIRPRISTKNVGTYPFHPCARRQHIARRGHGTPAFWPQKLFDNLRDLGLEYHSKNTISDIRRKSMSQAAAQQWHSAPTRYLPRKYCCPRRSRNGGLRLTNMMSRQASYICIEPLIIKSEPNSTTQRSSAKYI